MLALAGCFLASVTAGVLLFRRRGRLSAALLPVAMLLAAVQIVLSIARQPQLIWNDVRLARSAAMLRGFPLYPQKDTAGPVIGTLHTPASHVLYLAAAWIPTPTAAILVASAFSAVLAFAPLVWLLLLREPLPADGNKWCFLFCMSALLASPGANNAVFMIHTDPAALAFAALACASLLTEGHGYIASGIFIALAIWSKQTMLPLALCLSGFAWVADGARAAMRCLASAAISLCILLAVTTAFVGAPAFFFNVWTLATHRPLKQGADLILAQAFRDLKLEMLIAFLPTALFVAFSWPGKGRLRERVRLSLRENRWLTFETAAVSLAPAALKAIVTVGADVNHLGLVCYLGFAGAALGCLQYWESPLRSLRLAARVFVAAGIGISVTPGAAMAIRPAIAAIPANDTCVAWRYLRGHPGRVWFPWNPLAHVLAEGRVYHFEGALLDREVAGFPLGEQQVRAGIPVGRMIAFPPGMDAKSAAMRGFVNGFQKGSDPDLPGWTVYRAR